VLLPLVFTIDQGLFLFQGPAMTRDSIEKWQAAKIGKSLAPSLNYLRRLQHRMEKKRFPGNDPCYLAVCRAYDSMQALCVATHYLTCNGVGRPDRTE
jgi:hypothetical protein